MLLRHLLIDHFINFLLENIKNYQKKLITFFLFKKKLKKIFLNQYTLKVSTNFSLKN